MPGFDADAWLAEHEPWSLTLGGRAFRSRPVSVRAIHQYEVAARAAGPDLRKQRTALYQLLRAAFPWRPSYLLWGDPVAAILALDEAAQRAVLTDFFVSAVARLAPLLTLTTPPNGSVARTAPPPTNGLRAVS